MRIERNLAQSRTHKTTALGKRMYTRRPKSRLLQPIRTSTRSKWDPNRRRSLLDKFLLDPTTNTKRIDRAYNVTWKDISDAGGRGILAFHGSSAAMSYMGEYPEHAWKAWKFSQLPKYWLSFVASKFHSGDVLAEIVVREYVEELEQRLELNRPEDWIGVPESRISTTDLFRMSAFGGIWNVLSRYYPKLSLGKRSSKKPNALLLEKRQKIISSDWSSPQVRRQCLDQILQCSSHTLNESAQMRAYSTDAICLRRNRVRGLLEKYNDSAAMAFMTEYPEIAWLPWLFTRTPRGWWFIVSRQFADDPVAEACVREFVASSGLEVTPESQLNPKIRNIISTLAGSIEELLYRLRLTPHAPSNAPVVSSLFRPRGQRLSPSYWDDPRNRQLAILQLRQLLCGNSNSLDGLYSVKAVHFERVGARGLLAKYKGNPSVAIINELPNHKWEYWRFYVPPIPDYWNKLAAQIEALGKGSSQISSEWSEQLWAIYNYIAKQCSVSSLEDWYTADLRSNLDPTLRRRLAVIGPLEKLLEVLYPNHQWDTKLFKAGPLSHGTNKQIAMHKSVDELLDLPVT